MNKRTLDLLVVLQCTVRQSGYCAARKIWLPLTKKSTKRKRHLRGKSMVHESDQVLVERLLPYQR